MSARLFDLERALVELSSVVGALDRNGDEVPGESQPTVEIVAGAASRRADHALEVCERLIADVHMAYGVPCSADTVSGWAGARTKASGPSANDGAPAPDLPQLLRTTLGTLLRHDSVRDEPRGPSAVSARMLAAIIDTMERGEHVETAGPVDGRAKAADVVPLPVRSQR